MTTPIKPDENGLKPCPFCGSDDIREEIKSNNWSKISCQDCGTDIDREYSEWAIEAWNTRHSPIQTNGDEVEELAELLCQFYVNRGLQFCPYPDEYRRRARAVIEAGYYKHSPAKQELDRDKISDDLELIFCKHETKSKKFGLNSNMEAPMLENSDGCFLDVLDYIYSKFTPKPVRIPTEEEVIKLMDKLLKVSVWLKDGSGITSPHITYKSTIKCAQAIRKLLEEMNEAR